MGRVGYPAGLTLAQVKASVKLNELQAPDGAVAMNSQKLTGLAAGTAQNDSMRKGQAEVVLADLVPAVCSETEADDKIAAVTALNQVKLPSPSAGDYVTPSAVLASSSTLLDNLEAGWGYSEVDPDTELSDGGNDAGTKIEGAASRRLDHSNGVIQAGHYQQIAKSIDLTDINDLYFYYRQSYKTSSAIELRVLINGAQEYSSDITAFELNTWHVIGPVDVSGYSGANTVTLRYYCIAPVSLSTGYIYFDFLGTHPEPRTIDESLTSQWRPEPANEADAWCRWDTGTLKILGGCRIYWGADANYRPTNYDIDVSENGTDWIQVVNETEAAPASAWKEYSWGARYTRYIRIQVNTHGATGTEVFEMDYYSRIIDRVAAEHGHGSGVTPYLNVKYSEGHPKMERGETIKSKVRDLPTLLEYLNILTDGQLGDEPIKAVKADYDALKARVEGLEKK